MHQKVSKSQIDQLGERLRLGVTEADLQLLDSYRQSFCRSYEDVVAALMVHTGLLPTGRPTKSTTSICDKLARESMRLSQMQDVAGCRIVVPDIVVQDSVIPLVISLFDTAVVFDRRENPSHGYRAVHVVARSFELPIEVQVRTELQHIWAELSEKYSDTAAPEMKYGKGPPELQEFLVTASGYAAVIEKEERKYALDMQKGKADHPHEVARREEELAQLATIKQQLAALLVNAARAVLEGKD